MANVRAKLCADPNVILATLEAFGMGGVTRVVVMVEQPLVRTFVDVANESKSERAEASTAAPPSAGNTRTGGDSECLPGERPRR